MTGTRRPISRPLAVRLAFALLLAVASSAEAREVISLGPPDDLAIDQPRVAVEVIDPVTGTNFGPGYGDGFFDTPNIWLLDTAAQGIVAAGNAVADMVPAGYETVAVFEEIGVAGPSYYDVSKSYTVNYGGNGGQEMTRTDVRLLSSPTADFSGFGGIIGMPGMMGEYVELDLAALPSLGWIGTGFPDVLPPDPGHRYTVDLEMVFFPPAGQQHPDDPLPTYAPLPFVRTELFSGARGVGGWFPVDTGAQVSMISTAKAIDLGLDTDGDGNFENEAIGHLPIGGVGGSTTVPMIRVGDVRLTSRSGVDLEWTDANMIVVDIDEAIDGVLGMDLLISGWWAGALGGPAGYFNQIYMDFTAADSGEASMLLDLPAARDQVTIEPEAVANSAPGPLDWHAGGTWAPAGPDARTDAVISGPAIELTGQAAARELTVGGATGGSLRISPGVELRAMEVSTVGEGALIVEGTLVAQFGVEVEPLGRLSGGGLIRGDVRHEGTVRIGPAETLTIDGAWTQAPAAVLEVHLEGLGGSGGLDVTGPAELAGQLIVVVPGDGAVLPGDLWRVVSAESVAGLWDEVTISGLADRPGLWMEAVASVDGVDLVARALGGDADLDGQVAGSDLGTLARNFGRADADWLSGDFDGDGAVAASDLGALARNFGATHPTGVPAPPALLMWLVASCCLARRRPGAGR